MAGIVYVDTNTLPPTIGAALSSAGYARPIIGVYVRDTASMHAVSGDGMRGFTVLVDIDSGRSETHQGSWGGANMFSVNAVDSDTTERPLPSGACIISGHTGGGKPTYATLTIHPSRAAKLLPVAGEDLSDREKSLMAVFARFNSRGRAEWFGRHGKATEAELLGLESRGWIKRTKAGAVTCTAAGKNVAPNDAFLYR
jgi:hypothetical protein